MILSRRDPELIKTLFELEVPEIADGLVEIRGVAREPGYRSKIAVESHAQGVDPVGACVGPRGSRVRMVVSELRGEKIDIIPWNNEPARFVAKALSPARVREVYLDDEGREATVVVPDDQLALAIGKEGMNARLAARLTGWKIDITSDTEFAQQEADAAFGGEGGDGEDFSGRCAAVLSNGKRCPNAALPGSKYCGVPAHQELALHEPNDEDNPIVAESEPELEELADTAEPEAVTEDAAEFAGAPSPRSSRQARATRLSRARTRRSSPEPHRRSTGTSRTIRTTGSRSSAPCTRSCNSGGRTDPDVRRLRPQGASARAAALPRGGGASSSPGRGPGRGAYTCRRLPCFERAATRAAFSRDASPHRPRRPDPCPVSTLDPRWPTANRIDRSDRAAAAPRGGAASSSTRAATGPARASASGLATARPTADRGQPREVVAADRPGDRRVRRHAARLLAGARRRDAADHQAADEPRHDEDRDPVAHRRRGGADRRRARARGDDQARRRRRRRAGDVRGRRGVASRRARRSSRSWATSTTARRRCSTRSARRTVVDDRSRRDHAAHRRLPGRDRTAAGSRSSTRRATRRSPPCAPAARR